jgi:hypothetical protein
MFVAGTRMSSPGEPVAEGEGVGEGDRPPGGLVVVPGAGELLDEVDGAGDVDAFCCWLPAVGVGWWVRPENAPSSVTRKWCTSKLVNPASSDPKRCGVNPIQFSDW